MYSFVYDSDGIRTEKTVNGVKHTYRYLDGRLHSEEWGNHLMVFLYNDMGVPIGMRYRTSSYSANVWDTYWYERNLQGDIVAVYGDNGTKYVTYAYDAWGNHTPTYSNGGVSIVPVVNNPLRYRGYYYDSDLGLYYLQSRYYDSNTGRFINADSALYEGLLGSNMYAYCENNPVMYVDYSGESAALVLGTWLGVATPIAFAEPTLIGEIVVVAGVVTLLFVAVCELAEAVDDSKNDSKTKEAPKSVPQSDSNNEEKKQSSPGKMQREIEKGQAPKDVESVHNPQNGKPHVHFKDGTSMNNDGTPHDKKNGIPNLTKDVKKWLEKHNWPTEVIFP